MFDINKVDGIVILRKIFKLIIVSESFTLFLATYGKKFYSATFTALQLTGFCDYLLLTISYLFYFEIVY